MRPGKIAAVEVRVLGTVELVGEDGPIPVGAAMQRRLLAALALDHGRACSADLLLDALWAGTPPPSAAKLLQVYVSQLRKALPGAAHIRREVGGYLLDVPEGSFDAARFERLLEQGRAASAGGNAALAASLLRRALEIWRGPAYGELGYESFFRHEAERLDELRLAAHEERIDAELALGRDGELIPELQRLAAEHPLRERLQAQAMLALYRSGRQSDALEQYAATRVRLRDQLGLEPGHELQLLQRRILRHDPGLAPTTRARVPSVVLPAPPNTLLGRERELAELRGLLLRDDVRLLVLTGAGGSGKTRLALEAARAAAPSFANGAAFVELAPLQDPELVAPAISHTLAVTEEDGAGALAASLSQSELLLVVDNAEHLRSAAPIYAELLAGAPGLKILLTSRVVLHLSGEHVYPVEPLAEDAAVELFSIRAREAEPRLASGGEDEDAIRTICRRLDGLPLAIELAAARARALTPAELAAKLVPRLPLLTGGPRDLPARQQTLEATLAWSHDLLGDDERRDLRRLAVFTGGCTLEAAETVCETPLDRLGELVDHNLLFRVTADGSSRYSMLETIREFARDRLAESGEQDDVARSHAEYFLALAERAETTGEAAYAPGWLERLDAERDNFRAAVGWTLEAGDPLLALRTLTALTGLWTARGPHHEWRDWLTEALHAAPEAPAQLRATALRDLGASCFFTGEHDEGSAVSEQALELFRELGDTRGVASMLDRLAGLAALTGDHRRARDLAEESVALFRTLGDRYGALYPLSKIASDEWKRGDPELGIAIAEEAIALARESGDTWWLAGLFAQLGEMLRGRGDLERAAAVGRDCVSLAHDLGDARTLLHGFVTLAVLAAVEGDAARAGRLWGIAESLEARGDVRIADASRADYGAAARALAGPELDAGLAKGRELHLADGVAFALRRSG